MTTSYMRTPEGTVFSTDHPEYHKECELLKVTQKAGKELVRQQRIADLKEWVKPGTVLTTIVLSVSGSGMTRNIAVAGVRDGEIVDISWIVAEITGRKMGKNGGVIVGGCGMDMAFELVYTLGRKMFPEGFGIEGKDAFGHTFRPVSKEDAEFNVRSGATFRGRNGDSSGWDNDGGYALTQKRF